MYIRIFLWLYLILFCTRGIHAQGCQVKKVDQYKFDELAVLCNINGVKEVINQLSTSKKCLVYLSNQATAYHLKIIVINFNDSGRAVNGTESHWDTRDSSLETRKIKGKSIQKVCRNVSYEKLWKTYLACLGVTSHNSYEIIQVKTNGQKTGGYISNGTEKDFSQPELSLFADLLEYLRRIK